MHFIHWRQILATLCLVRFLGPLLLLVTFLWLGFNSHGNNSQMLHPSDASIVRCFNSQMLQSSDLLINHQMLQSSDRIIIRYFFRCFSIIRFFLPTIRWYLSSIRCFDHQIFQSSDFFNHQISFSKQLLKHSSDDCFYVDWFIWWLKPGMIELGKIGESDYCYRVEWCLTEFVMWSYF